MIALEDNGIKQEKVLKILNNVVDSEKKRYGINPNVSICTTFQYYKDNFKDGGFSLRSAPIILAFPHIVRGYRGFNEIVVFLGNSFYKLNNIDEHKFLLLLVTTYHELRHEVQHKCINPFSDYEIFLLDYLNISSISRFFNLSEHDSVYGEIDANLYSANMVKDVMGSVFSEKENNYLNKLINRYSFLKNNYDFDGKFALFCEDYKKNYKNHSNEPFLSVFFKYGNFKRIDNIVNSMWYKGIDEIIRNMVLSSDVFLDNIDYDLSLDEKEVLGEALDYRIKDLENAEEINADMCKSDKISITDYGIAKLRILDQINKKKMYFDRFCTSSLSKH